MGTLTTIAQFILSLSILIVLHECGHFFPARWFKTRVEKFYLFFNPWFSLFKIKRGDTEYGIGWLPLGGYVKIAGMMDESMDKEQLKKPAQPWEFRSKPAWQRLIIMLGGVTVNYVLGFIIFTGMLLHWGKQYLPANALTYGIATDSLAQAYGLQDGDKLLAIDGKPLENFDAARLELLLSKKRELTIQRDSQTIDLLLTKEQVGQLATRKSSFIAPRFPFVIKAIPDNSQNKETGLQAGDQVLAVDSTPTPFFHNVQAELKRHPSDDVEATLLRGTDTVKLQLLVDDKGKLNIRPAPAGDFLTLNTKQYGFGEAVVTGFSDTYGFLRDYMRQLGLIFNGTVRASESLGGFVTIAENYGTTWDWYNFWRITGILSIILAFMNLLPIPALDGGHVMFLLYEVITRRKPNEKFLEYAQLVGFVLLIGLLLYANGLDIYRKLF